MSKDREKPPEQPAPSFALFAQVEQGEKSVEEIPVEEMAYLFQKDALVGKTVRNGSVQIEKLLGQGGMGRVYTAFQSGLSRNAALKALARTQGEAVWVRFVAEAQEVAKLHHPNVVAVYDFWTELVDGCEYAFLLMKKIHGPSLEQLVETRGPIEVSTSLGARKALSFEHALELTRKIGAGLSSMHGRGIIHRDMKPDNVLIDTEEVDQPPVLIDLGIAKSTREGVSEADRHKIKTLHGDVFGTPNSMSPEQAMGKMDLVRIPADVYALTVILYFLLTGIFPFEDLIKMQSDETFHTIFLRWQMFHCTNADLLSDGKQEVHPTPVSLLRPDVPAWVDGFINKGLSHEIGKRFQSVNSFFREMNAHASVREAVASDTATLLLPSERITLDTPLTRAPTMFTWGNSVTKTRRIGFGVVALILSGCLAFVVGVVALIKPMHRVRRDARVAITRLTPVSVVDTGQASLEEDAGTDEENVSTHDAGTVLVRESTDTGTVRSRPRGRAPPCRPHLLPDGTLTVCF